MKRTIFLDGRTLEVDDETEEVRLGPMSDAERESLLALAEELRRRRNIDAEAWLRMFFVDPPQKSKGRHAAPPDEEARDERLLSAYRSALGLLQRIDRGTPPEATTVREILEAARLVYPPSPPDDGEPKHDGEHKEAPVTLRLEGDGFAPYLEAVAAYREGLRGGDALDVRAAMLAFGMEDDAEATAALRALQARVRRRRTSRTTE